MSFDIGNNYVTEAVSVYLANAMQNNFALVNVCFSNCSMKNSAVPILESIQMKVTSLTHLYLQHNPIRFATVELFAAALRNCVKLKCLDVSNCLLTELALTALFNELQNLRRLECLYLSSSNITKPAANKLAVAVSNNLNLQHLALSRCQLSPPALSVIASALTKLVNLREFDISYNTIDKCNATEIATVIKNNVFLERLNLSNCNLNHSAACTITDAVASLSSLLSLNLCYNFVNKQASLKLTAAIHNNMDVEELQLSGCFLQDVSFLILSAVKMKPLLKSINASSNFISYQVLDLLVTSFKNSKIEFIDLSECHLTEFACLRLLKGLEETYSLSYFSIARNKITERMANEMALVLEKNKRLKYLNISGCNLPESFFLTFMKCSSAQTQLKFNISSTT